MKTTNSNPKEDLQAIREIMERSSKFLSLSGLSGVFAGVCALAGAAVAWFIILDSGQIQYDEYLHSLGASPTSNIRLYLGFDALLVLIVAILGAVYFSFRFFGPIPPEGCWGICLFHWFREEFLLSFWYSGITLSWWLL
jgi:hypothetical protein